MLFSPRSQFSATANDDLLERLKLAARPLSVSMLVALTGCVASQKALVPMDKVVVQDEIRMSTVIAAVRCEVGKGLNHIGDEIRKNADDPRYKSFRIYSGTMTFTGTIKVVEVGGANVAAVIPIGTSLLTPSAGYTSTQTAQQDVERQFKILVKDIPEELEDILKISKRLLKRRESRTWDTESEKKHVEKLLNGTNSVKGAISALEDAKKELVAEETDENKKKVKNLEYKVKHLQDLKEIINDVENTLSKLRTKVKKLKDVAAPFSGIPREIGDEGCPKNVESSDFISKAIIVQFDDQFDDTISSASQAEPGFKNISLGITTSFTVARKPEGKVTLNAIFNNPRLTSIDPVLNASIDETNIYAVKLNFPLKRDAEPAETRVVVDCKFNVATGLSICVEQPFDEAGGDRFNTFRALGFPDIFEAEAAAAEDRAKGLEPGPEPPTAPIILDSFSPAF